MNKFLATALIAAALGLFGCTASSYNIKVNGYTEPSAPALAFGSTFFVIQNQKAKNPLLEQEVQGKINKLLVKHGYSLAPYEKADYYLFFSYGIGGDHSTTVVMPDYPPYGGSFGFGVGPAYGYRSSSYFFVAPFFSYYPYPEAVTLYDRWLLINVVDGKYYRDKGQFRTIWVGEARSLGTSSDLRTVLNYLLVADFKVFGKNTGKATTMEIGPEEPQVYGLMPLK